MSVEGMSTRIVLWGVQMTLNASDGARRASIHRVCFEKTDTTFLGESSKPWKTEELSETDVGSDLPCGGPKAIGSYSGVAVISENCKGNSSAVEYLLGLKLIRLHVKDVSFATDQMERHLVVENTGYVNYDSSAKRHLLMSLGIFLRIYYKGGMLGEQSASLPRASVLTEGQPTG
ncbi:Uncharacterized protein Adt_41792 [Abeliophyllum distichum]|uniref:Uncharacterized protein n=1 Tax=Abeliophyllum distichum TaxID=126358 RepID=A0ABD1PTS9_9LAMI